MQSKCVVLSLAALAVVAVLPATSVTAADPLPPGWSSCNTVGTGQWTIEVVDGPCPVTSGSPTACAGSGNYTGIKYKITGPADHVATIVTKNNNVVSVPAIQFYAACDGDPVTGLGKYSCHERAIKVNPDQATKSFWLVVEGNKLPVLQSVVAKKGNKIEACAIAGFGADPPDTVLDACVSSCGNFHPKQTILKEEVYRFKTGTGVECFAKFELDTTTGNVISFTPDPRSDPACDFVEYDVSQLELLLDGTTIVGAGLGQFGDGFLSTGSDSCTSRFIGGRWYVWGNPCPE